MVTKIATYQRILQENKKYSDSNSVFFMSNVKGGIHPASNPMETVAGGHRQPLTSI
jgi:hypothetical protein